MESQTRAESIQTTWNIAEFLMQRGDGGNEDGVLELFIGMFIFASKNLESGF
jgi:hypothetical protein